MFAASLGRATARVGGSIARCALEAAAAWAPLPSLGSGLCHGAPSATPGSARSFAVKRTVQRRRSRGRIIQLKQTHYEPKPDGYAPVPLSLMGSGHLRRVIKAGTVEARQLAAAVDWDRYKCDVKGVRWHPVGGWRVQFDRRDYEHNFFVKCSCYFRVPIYGFDRAKELAIAYRLRLEAEWEEQEQIWARLDAEREAKRLQRREERERARRAAEFEGVDSFWGTETFLPPPAEEQGA
mmetsp:Transcript_94359/g.250623  ORF Transcript_94359/g.250623 Transcript_94359/m.250623 type:complete len:237 (-) Transcript_94359:14-724(-)